MRSTDHFRQTSSLTLRPASDGVVIGRRILAAGSAILLLALVWAGAASWWVLSRPDGGLTAAARSTELRYAYEDRIGQLTGKLEGEVTRNLVDRSAVEARMAKLVARQAEIETAQAWLRSITERVSGRELPVAAAPRADGARDAVRVLESRKPSPDADAPELRLRSESRAEEAPVPRDRLSALERSVERIAAEELRMLDALGHGTRTRVARLRSAIDATGVDVGRSASSRPAGIGGPLVPVPVREGQGAFRALTSELDLRFGELSRLQDAARLLPLAAPLSGEIEQTSSFGTRTDPFTRAPALHTGIDFRSETGTPALATAAGTVVSAEAAGGYGLMVEVDHGRGLSTRYGHLSAILVAVGDRVVAGQPVGRVGSTGRSTGPHLHYETRIGGEPVNPVRFLDAGRLLSAPTG